MTVYELVQKNRSYRGYNSQRAITREELLQMVECARLCPSSINVQPLKYYLAWEKNVVDRIQPCTGWAKALPEMNLPHEGMCPTAFIVICQDKSIDSSLARYQRDVGIVAQTILLAATEMGLGGCMIGSFQAGEVRSALNLPENLAPALVVAIGEPAEKIVLTDIGPDGSTKYYRDENDTHYVPKRALEDLIVG